MVCSKCKQYVDVKAMRFGDGWIKVCPFCGNILYNSSIEPEK
jgi:hypothetical protein